VMAWAGVFASPPVLGVGVPAWSPLVLSAPPAWAFERVALALA